MAKPDTDARDADGDGDTPIERCKQRFAIAAEVHEPNRKDALDDIRFARLAEQWPEKIKKDREQDNRPCLTINRLPGFIRQVVNDARQNKPGITVHPVGSGADPETAEIMNGLIRHVEQSSDAEVAYDTALDNAVTGGFGYFRINTRYACDDTFEQDLTIERIADPLSVYGDPNSRAADSSDWNEAWIVDSMPKAAFEERWPDADAVSFEADTYVTRNEVSDEELIQIAEWWTREKSLRTITAISPPSDDQVLAMPAAAAAAAKLAGPNMIISLDAYEANKDTFQALGMAPVGKTRDVETYKVTQRICSGADVLETVDWAGTYIPIVPVYGEEVFVEGVRHLRSMVRDAKDPQRMLNYWRTTSTELVALAPKTPFIGQTGQFVTDAVKWANANTATYSYIEYDIPEGAQDIGPPQRQPYAGVPAGAVNEANTAGEDIMSIVGIYKASLGASSNEDSGVAINARDRQADTGTFHFIDNLSRAIRHAGRILIDLIPHVYSTARVLRIIHPDGTPDMVKVNQPVAVNDNDGKPQMQADPQTGEMKAITRIYDLTAGKYDLTVAAGPSFATQRQEFVEMATEIIRSFPAAAPVLSDILFRNMDMPHADEIADRLQALLPAPVRGVDPQLQQAHQIIQEGVQRIQALEQQIAALKGDQSNDSRKLDIDAFEAETDRFKAIVGKDGAPADPTQMAQVVMTSLFHIMQSPDIFEAMAGGAQPDQLAQMLAAKMQAQPGQGQPPPALAA